MELNGGKVGVVTASIAYEYAKDAFPADTSFLKLGLTNPLPMNLIREFASKVEKLYVIEELDSFMEDQIKAAGIDCIGKELTTRWRGTRTLSSPVTSAATRWARPRR